MKNRWTPIRYRELWDVPRIFLVTHGRLNLLFDCVFDEDSEDYSETYDVYVVPEFSEQDLTGSWHQLRQRAIRFLKVVPVSSLRFDPSTHAAIDSELLDELAEGLAVASQRNN